jgi:hypothetical protein
MEYEMNSLSWLIYWAGAVDTFNGFGAFFTFIGCVGLIAWLITNIIFAFVQNGLVDDDPKGYKLFRNIIAKSTFPFLIIGALIVTFVPSRQTIILIAASQVGEQIVNNPKVQGVIDPSVELLKSYMQKETEKILHPPQKQ